MVVLPSLGQITQERQRTHRLAMKVAGREDTWRSSIAGHLCVGLGERLSCRELTAEEYGGLRHDQLVGILSAEKERH